MRRIYVTQIGLIIVCLISLSGCGKGQPGGPEASKGVAAEEHAHDDEGPHGGHVIELGVEDYHAELTHAEDSHVVGVYLLGSDAKTAAPIEAEKVTINVAVDGQSSQYDLSAAAQEGESAGKASYFELDSEPLHTVVSGESESKNTKARLSLTIGGKPYVGLIETGEHDHEHGHAH